MKQINTNTDCGVIISLKNTLKIKISVSQHISKLNCMNYDHNQFWGLFKFKTGYRKYILNSPKGYSRKIINAQTGKHPRSYAVSL